MVKISLVYEGDLHCKLTHGPSGTVINTDAPTDNMGKGACFSPTDLAASSLGSCMLTTMAIVAQRHALELKGMSAEVLKEMVTAPERRIGKIHVTIYMPKGLDAEKRAMLERAAKHCPVHLNLNPTVEIPTTFVYPD